MVLRRAIGGCDGAIERLMMDDTVERRQIEEAGKTKPIQAARDAAASEHRQENSTAAVRGHTD